MYKYEKAMKCRLHVYADCSHAQNCEAPFQDTSEIHASPLLKNMGSLNMFIPCYDSTLLIFPLPS